ncbi:MAG: hypothetical protein AAB490_01620 [Patescibacteria group bacterium]
MTIAIVASIDFTPKIQEVADRLSKDGHKVDIPFTSQRIINGELTLEEFIAEKEKNGDGLFRKAAMRKIKDDVIIRYYNKIKECDAILVLNLEKKGITNYIGGNALIEIAFAHVLGKKIYLLNDIPDILYTDEIIAMQPIIINGDLSKIE